MSISTSAKQSVSYQSGTTQVNGGVKYIGGSSVALGTSQKSKVFPVTQEFLGTDPSFATVPSPGTIVGLPSIRTESLPSGYSVLGVPTYGSGRSFTNTVLATDTSKTDAMKLIFLNGGVYPSGRGYNSLT